MKSYFKTKTVRLKGKALIKLYDSVKKRDGGCCLISGIETNDGPHHIIPRATGGDVSSNLATLDWNEVHFHIHHGNDKGIDHVVDLIESKYGDLAVQYCNVELNTIAEIVQEYGRLKFIQFFLLGLVAEMKEF